MCNSCGCHVTSGNQHLIQPEGALAKTSNGKASVEVLGNLLAANDQQAAHNREHFDEYGVLTINLMSSPGSGKTALLEATIRQLQGRLKMAVIEGDLETENDANRIRKLGVEAIQIVTGTACHLDAHMLHDALHQLPLAGLDVLFIENVGNLVCPASFDLGHHINVILLSVTEGDDKPEKYPVMFRAADLVLLSKTDLLPYLDDFSPGRVKQSLQHIASAVPVMRVSSKQPDSIEAWIGWLQDNVARQKQRGAAGEKVKPHLQADGLHLHGHTHSPQP